MDGRVRETHGVVSSSKRSVKIMTLNNNEEKAAHRMSAFLCGQLGDSERIRKVGISTKDTAQVVVVVVVVPGPGERSAIEALIGEAMAVSGEERGGAGRESTRTITVAEKSSDIQKGPEKEKRRMRKARILFMAEFFFFFHSLSLLCPVSLFTAKNTRTDGDGDLLLPLKEERERERRDNPLFRPFLSL